MNHDNCPDHAELVAFHLGDLSEEDNQTVGIHLEGCLRCEAALESLDALTDPVLAALQLPKRNARRPSHTRNVNDSRDSAPVGHLDTELLALPNYELLCELGRGGMGVVYKARQVKLNRLVALKMLGTTLAVEPETLFRFQLEGEAIARLQHPNLVQIFEVGNIEGMPFLAMELVDGGSLEERLDGSPQSPAPGCRTGRDPGSSDGLRS